MKSPINRTISRRSHQPVTVINDTKYITKVSERTLPRRYYAQDDYFEREHFGRFLSLYGMICIYIFLVLAIMIGGGGVAICIAYYNSTENTQNWKICGIVLGLATCIITVILLILTIMKQTRNRPWRYQVKDVLLHPENYFSEDSGTDSDDDDADDNDQTLDTTVTSVPNPSIGLLKTVHNDLVYCLGCNRLHSSSEECVKPTRAGTALPPLKKKTVTMSDMKINYTLSNETQMNNSGTKTGENLVLKRTPVSSKKVIAQQPPTKIMIVRVPKVPGELVIQPKEH